MRVAVLLTGELRWLTRNYHNQWAALYEPSNVDVFVSARPPEGVDPIEVAACLEALPIVRGYALSNRSSSFESKLKVHGAVTRPPRPTPPCPTRNAQHAALP